MTPDVRVVGPPRKSAENRVGYGYALPLSESPREEWIRLFNEGWTSTPGMRHEPIVDSANSEIAVNISLQDKEIARGALDKVVVLVDQTTEKFEERVADAAQQATADKAAAEAAAAETREFFSQWWTAREPRRP